MNKIIRPTIYVDLDGVVANLDNTLRTRCVKIFGENSGHIIADKFREKFSDETFAYIDSDPNFWSNMQLYPHSYELIKLCQQHGDVVFLSFSGWRNLRPYSTANTAYGKILWVEKHFPDIELILCREKFRLANQNSILIDDNLSNVTLFQNNGIGFLWDKQNPLVAFEELRNMLIEKYP